MGPSQRHALYYIVWSVCVSVFRYLYRHTIIREYADLARQTVFCGWLHIWVVSFCGNTRLYFATFGYLHWMCFVLSSKYPWITSTSFAFLHSCLLPWTLPTFHSFPLLSQSSASVQVSEGVVAQLGIEIGQCIAWPLSSSVSLQSWNSNDKVCQEIWLICNLLKSLSFLYLSWDCPTYFQSTHARVDGFFCTGGCVTLRQRLNMFTGRRELPLKVGLFMPVLT